MCGEVSKFWIQTGARQTKIGESINFLDDVALATDNQRDLELLAISAVICIFITQYLITSYFRVTWIEKI